MSIASEITRLQNAKAALKESIEAKGVTVEDSAKLDEYPELVDSIPQGGGDGVEEKDVNFYDYNGKRLYSYTKDEFLALNEMPIIPDDVDEGLFGDEWNWSLEGAKTEITNYKYKLDIGAFYSINTTSIKLYINIQSTTGTLSLNLRAISPDKHCYINWGDGTNIEEITFTMSIFTHQYNKGTYQIEITSDYTQCCQMGSGNEESIIEGGNYIYKLIFGSITNGFGNSGIHDLLNLEFAYVYNIGPKFVKNNKLKKVLYDKNSNSANIISDPLKILITKGVNIQSCGNYFYLTERICFGENSFDANSYSSSASISKTSTKVNNITHLKKQSNYNCSGYGLYNLEKLYVKNKLNSQSFQDCYSLIEVTIDSDITEITSQCFYNSGLRTIFILNPTPLTLGSSSFSGTPLEKIYVPAESVEAYKGATNWSAYADKIFAIPTE